MARFLIEVPHEPKKSACMVAVRIFLETGSHFLTNAEWGCSDGEHNAWIILEAESKEAARAIVPATFRSQAKIVRLDRYTMKDVDQIMLDHQD